MNLKKSTQVNAVMFYDNKSNNVFSSSNLNISFDDFLKESSNGIDLKIMYEFEYTLNKTMESENHQFNMYSYKDDRFSCSFIELIEK